MHSYLNHCSVKTPRSFSWRFCVFPALLLALLFPTFSFGQILGLPSECGGLGFPKGGFWPSDYRASRYRYELTYQSHAGALLVVEAHHFTPQVEALVHGETNTLPGPDIDYTLRHFPNHYRALIAMALLGDKTKTNKPSGSSYTLECWFLRAIAFSPDDNVSRLLYANYLAKHDQANEASKQLEIAANQADNYALTYQNIGLIYFEMKYFANALKYSHIAFQLGMHTQLLIDKLKQADKWSPPIEP